MEIRSVKKREVSYPKMREVSVEKVKKAIPNTWVKLGITSVLFNVLMGNKVWGISETDIFNDLNNPPIIAGAEPTHTNIIVVSLGSWLVLITVMTAFVTSITILCKKIKSRKNNKIKIGKNLKIACIVSSIMTIMYTIIRLLF